MQCFNFKAEVSWPQICPSWQSKKAIYQIYHTSAWIKIKKWADVSIIGPGLIVLNNSMISIFLKFVAHWQGRQAHLLSCLGLQGNKTTGCYLIWPPYYCLSHMVLNWEWAGESHGPQLPPQLRTIWGVTRRKIRSDHLHSIAWRLSWRTRYRLLDVFPRFFF